MTDFRLSSVRDGAWFQTIATTQQQLILEEIAQAASRVADRPWHYGHFLGHHGRIAVAHKVQNNPQTYPIQPSDFTTIKFCHEFPSPFANSWTSYVADDRTSREHIKKVAIIGTGAVGAPLAKGWARKRHQIA